MIKVFLSLAIIMTAMFGNGMSGESRGPAYFVVENQNHYQQIINTSPISHFFEDCTLVDSGEAHQLEYLLGQVFIRQTYVAPLADSKYGISYHLYVSIKIENDSILNLADIKKSLGDYKEQITDFESIPAIIEFVRVVKPDKLFFNGTQINSGGYGESKMGFNLSTGKFDFILIKSEELFPKLDLFFPELTKMEWYKEFDAKVGVKRIYLENDKVEISPDSNCPTCRSHIIYNLHRSQFHKISLTTDQSWTHFPMVNYAIRAAKERLVGDTLGTCFAGILKNHVYVILDRGHGLDWFARVAINCREVPRRRDVCFRIKPDSTIDRFRVCYQSGN